MREKVCIDRVVMMIVRSVAVCRALFSRPLVTTWRFRCSTSREPEYGSSEKLISVSDVVKEAAELGDNFVFTDNSDEPVFKYEEALRGVPEKKKTDMAEPKTPSVSSAALDVTSAYAPEQGFKEITVDELKEKLERKQFALLLDVRGPSEFETGHVPGARNIPLGELTGDYVDASDLKDFKEKAIAVICGIGKRSAQATVRLSKVLGFSDVTSVAAGTKEWIAKGYEIEK